MSKTKTTPTARRISRDVATTRQALVYRAIWALGEHRLRVRRKRDSYDFQSYAVIERWNGEQWREVESIPYSLMSHGPADSYVSRAARPNPSEIADEAELIRRASLVLR